MRPLPARPSVSPATPFADPRIGIIGLGAFGRFIAERLATQFAVTGHEPAGGGAGIAAAAAADIVVLAVPVAGLADALDRAAPHLRPGAIVVDVCSVKAASIRILSERLPVGVTAVHTHPLFGPESGRHGVAGLPLVICGSRSGAPLRLAAALRRRFGLSIRFMDADDHDREMAQVQALTHAIARTMAALDLPEVASATASYRHLLAIRDLLCHDSPALFASILADNPHAGPLLDRFRTELQALTAPHIPPDQHGGKATPPISLAPRPRVPLPSGKSPASCM